MYCKNCGKELKSENKFCPFCGAETGNMAEPVSLSDGQKKPKKKIWMVLPAVLAAICIAFGVYRVVNTTSENGAKEEWVATVKEDGKWYVINGKNEKLAEVLLDDILNIYNFNEYGVAVVEVGQAEDSGMAYANPDITYINTDGEILASLFENFTGYVVGAYGPIRPGDNWCCGRGIIEVNGKYGFIDTEGKVKVLPVYDKVFGFGNNGLAAVKTDDRWGYVDIEGEMVIEPSYFSAETFSENGLALVTTQDGEQCFIDSDGEIVIDTGYNVFTSDYIVYSFDKNGFAYVELDGMKGVMNEDGTMITEIAFDEVASCYEDRILVWRSGIGFGIMDAQGALCVETAYDNLGCLNGKSYAISIDDHWGVIDQNGKEIVEPIYNYMGVLGKKKWIGYFDDSTKVCLLNHDGTVAETWEGDEDFWHAYVYNRKLDEEELLAVKTSGTWNFVDDEAKIRFKTEEEIELIDSTINFTGSPIAVQNDNNWGYIDANGKMMIDFQYEEVNSFFDKGSLDL